MTAPGAVPVYLMPDAEEVAVAFLADVFPDHNIVTELYMGFEDELPLIRVSRIGGAQVRPLVLDGPRIDVDVYHGTRLGASELCRTVAAHMPAAKGREYAGGLITSVAEEVGPSWRPEFNPSMYHFGATFVLTIRPTS
jgi:hypothetical protein